MVLKFKTDILPLYTTDVVTDTEYSSIDAARRSSDAEKSILTMVEIMRAFMAEFRDAAEARAAHFAMSRMLAAYSASRVYTSAVTEVVGNYPGVATLAANSDTVTITTTAGTDTIVLANGPFATATAIATEINSQIVFRVLGSKDDVATTAADDDTIVVDGTAITIAGAPFADTDALVSELNTALAAADVEAFAVGGRLGFRNKSDAKGLTFTLAAGEGANSLLTRAGLAAGTYGGEVEAFASGSLLGFKNGTGNTAVSFTLGHGGGASLLNKAGITAGTFYNPIEVLANAARDDALSHFTRDGTPNSL